MKSALLLLALAPLALAPLAFAQGYYPPSAAPGPTYRSMDEINPRIPLNQFTTPGDSTSVFKITKAGSYMLTGNLKPPAGKNGILIGLLVPGVVEVDMLGFTIDGSDAGPGAAAVLTDNSAIWTDDDDSGFGNGTIRNFGTAAYFPAVAAAGTLELSDLRILGGGAGVNTAARLLMRNVFISGGSGIPVQMGGDSVLQGVTIKTSHAGIPKIIAGTGSRHRLTEVAVSSFSFGASQPTAIELGPESTINGMSLRLTDATFTSSVLSNTSGFTEVSGLDMELNNVTAPTACNSYSFGASQPGILGTTYGGNGQGFFTYEKIASVITANNCTFSSAVVNLPALATSSDNCCPRFSLTGTTTTTTVLRVDGEGLTIAPKINIAATTSVTGPVLNVSGNGNTVSAGIRGLPSGGTGILISAGRSSRVIGCSISGRNDGPVTGIRLAAGVKDVLVNNENITEFAAGSTVVDNQGGASNPIAPYVSGAAIATNTNPFAIIIH